MRSAEIENIFENSDFVVMLNQGPGDRKLLATMLNISEKQLNFVQNAPAGEGLLVFGDIKIPFRNPFPQDTQMYKLMTTKPKEVLVSTSSV